MRVTVTALVLAVLAALYGGWLIGRWALGLVLIVAAAGVAAWAVFGYDDGQPSPQAGEMPTVASILERERYIS